MISDDDVVPTSEEATKPSGSEPAKTAEAVVTRRDPIGGTDHERPVRRPSNVLIPAVLLALLVGALALALVQTSKAGDAADQRDELEATANDRQAATLVAAQFAEAFFTYDHADVEGSTARVFALVTDEYRRNFEEENVPGLEDLFGEVALVSSGIADEVYVGEIDGDTARALARVDIDTDVQGIQRTLADLTLSITLRRQGGEWRVDAVTIVQAHPEGDDLTVPTATTGTTAPG